MRSKRYEEPESDDGMSSFIDILFVMVFCLVLFVRAETDRLAVAQGEGGAAGVSQYDPINGVNISITADGIEIDGRPTDEDALIRSVRRSMDDAGKAFINYSVADAVVSGRALPLREKLCHEFGRQNVFEILTEGEDSP